MKQLSIRRLQEDTTVEQFRIDVMKLSRTEAFALVDALAAALPSWKKDLEAFEIWVNSADYSRDDSWVIQQRLFFAQRVEFGQRMIKMIKEAFNDK